jgi:outer membrane receptor protein involved in Fe transport
MRRKASLWAGVAGIALVSSLGSAPMAIAQQADAQTPTVVEDIVVQARRRDERLIDVPVAITAIGGESLSDYSVSRVSDLATLVPSLVTGKAASGSSASIFLRGVGSTALSAGFDQSVSFVIDGLPMSRGREISLPQFDIQNVEVLKGPQALFYGKNTTGGLINVNSNNPTANFEAGAKTGYGFEGQEWYGEAYVSGPITDTLRGRFAARLSDSKGAFTNTAADTYPALVPGQDDWHRPSDHRGGAQSRAARLTLDWDPTSQLSVRLKAGMTSVDDGGPTDIIERICGGGRTTPASANGLPPSPNADCKIDGRSDSSALPRNVAEANYRYARDGEPYAEFGSEYAVVTAKWEDDKFDVESITGYYHFDQYDLNNVSGEAYPASFTQFADFTQYSQELRFETKFDGPINFSTGAFWARGEFEFNTDAYIIPLPLDPVTGSYVTFRRDNGFKSDSMSVFAQASWAIGDQWELSGGGRYSKEKRDSYQRSLDGHSFVAANFPGGIALYDEYDDDNFSPEVTLRYKPAHDTTIYAAYKQGFKAGGFNVSQALTPDASVEKGRFGAETAQGFEAGLRTLALDRRLNLGITAYHYLYEDLQVQYYDPQTNSLTAGNAGKLRTMGIEADFNYRVASVAGLSFRGAAAWNSAEYQDYIGQCYPGQTIAEGCNKLEFGGVFNGQDYEGRTPPKAPEFAGRLGASFERAVTASGITLKWNGDLSYTSDYNFTDALRPDAVQDAFTKIDTSIALVAPDGRWTVSLIGRNLTNELVVTAANDIPFSGGTGTGTTTGVLADMSAFVDNHREVYLEFAWRF